MAMREREYGDFRFPVGEFNRFLKEFKAFYDPYIAKAFDLAERIYQAYGNIPYDEMYQKSMGDRLKFGASEADMKNAWLEFLPSKVVKGKVMVQRPMKKHLKERSFSAHKARAKKNFDNDFLIEFAYYGSLRVIQRDLAVIWEVDESKRAVEEARRHEIAKWFFQFLKTVKWTKTTGGEVQYMNENMEDAGQWDPAINDRHGWAQKVCQLPHA